MNGTNRRGGPENGPGGSSAHRQASEWLVLLESGNATDEERARFEEWLAEAPGHREEYAALGETWERLAAMRGRARVARPGPDIATRNLHLLDRPKRRTRRWIWTAAAATLAAAVLGGSLLLTGDSAIHYRTGIGEHRTVSLPDGSTFDLNTDTELVVEYTDERRRVGMIRGEAFFDVAGDADRRFEVVAGQGAIRAVGTGFAVRLRAAGVVSVMVTEGFVEVVHLGGGHTGMVSPNDKAEPPVLQRGQRAEYGHGAPRIEEIALADLERTQAWRRGLLVFENASLAEVIAEVNRYTETRLLLADPRIGRLRLGGTFKTGRVEALLNVLEKNFGIRARHEGSDAIVLHAPLEQTVP